MAQIFNPILDKYFRFVNQATFQLDGTDYEIPLGDIEASGATPAFEDIERKSREFALKTTAAIATIGSDINLTLTAMSLTREVAQMMWMDKDGDFANQDGQTNLSKTFTNLVVGRVYNLGYENVEINSADDGATVDPIEFVEGTHIRPRLDVGRVQLNMIPEGATKLVVNFDALPLTDEDDIAVYGGMSSPGVQGTLRYYGVSNIGQNFIVEFWRCRIRPAGEIALQGADDYGQVALEARVFADGTKPEKYRYFKARELKD